MHCAALSDRHGGWGTRLSWAPTRSFLRIPGATGHAAIVRARAFSHPEIVQQLSKSRIYNRMLSGHQIRIKFYEAPSALSTDDSHVGLGPLVVQDPSSCMRALSSEVPASRLEYPIVDSTLGIFVRGPKPAQAGSILCAYTISITSNRVIILTRPFRQVEELPEC